MKQRPKLMVRKMLDKEPLLREDQATFYIRVPRKLERINFRNSLLAILL